MEPADAEPDVAPVVAWLLVAGFAVGLVVAAGLATVTVGALAVAVSVLPGTDTVALNLIVSPPGADFGTLTSASICGVPGSLAGSVSAQLVLLQLPTVKTGLLNAGVFAPGVSVVAIVPPSAEVDQAEILNRTVLPGCTLLADAVTASRGFVGAGVLVCVGASVGVGVALADGVGDVALVAVELGFGSAVGVVDFTVGVGEAAGAEDVGGAGVGDAAAVLDATGVADASVLDGVGVAARAVPAAPLEITKRPVARPSVTGRAYADRMRTPCLVSCDCWECALRNVVSSLGYGLPLGQERSHSTLIPALNATPRDRLVSFCFQFVTQS